MACIHVRYGTSRWRSLPGVWNEQVDWLATSGHHHRLLVPVPDRQTVIQIIPDVENMEGSRADIHHCHGHLLRLLMGLGSSAPPDCVHGQIPPK